MVNGVAMANPDKIAWCLGSDGAQQEGNDSEAARLAAARNLNVKLVIDDNNVTIAGHPADYLKGYNVEKTLEVGCVWRACVSVWCCLSRAWLLRPRALVLPVIHPLPPAPLPPALWLFFFLPPFPGCLPIPPRLPPLLCARTRAHAHRGALLELPLEFRSHFDVLNLECDAQVGHAHALSPVCTQGHGMTCYTCNGEDLDALYAAMRKVCIGDGPQAVVCKRPMCPGIEGIEGECHGHDAIAVKKAVEYLTKRGYTDAVAWLEGPAKKATKDPRAGKYKGTDFSKVGANRAEFGVAMCSILGGMTEAERKSRVMVIDSDLEGSTGLKVIHQKFPDIFVQSGIMERANLQAACGFGMDKRNQAVFSTFAAFQEMCISEITMGRLNFSNVLCHFSHSGVDDMADNTCHFGLNNFFADNGVEEHEKSSLYFPADPAQLHAVVPAVFWDQGMRFIYTTRSKLPAILDSEGKPFFGEGYKFVKGKDDVLRKGKAGYIVSFGDALYRAMDAVECLKEEGIDCGLINKCCLNAIDEDVMDLIGNAGFVMVVEPFNRKQGLGVRFGSWLLERGYTPAYGYIGATKEGSGGLWEHAYHQGYDSLSIQASVKNLVQKMLIQKALKK